MANMWTNNVISNTNGGNGSWVPAAICVLLCVWAVVYIALFVIGIYKSLNRSSFVPSNERQVYWGYA